MISYTYKDPLENGYTQVYLTKAQHQEVFPNSKPKWIDSYEYYIKDTDFLVNKFESVTCRILNWLTCPLAVLYFGVGNWKAVVKDSCKTRSKEKQQGNFVSNKVLVSSDAYKKIEEMLEYKP